MGLRFSPDSYYAGTAESLFLLTPTGEWTLPGTSAGLLLDRLRPFLDGRHTLAELTERLPGPRRTAVRHLVEALRQRGAIEDTDDPVARPFDGPIVLLGAEGPLRAEVAAALRTAGLGAAINGNDLDGAALVLHIAETSDLVEAERVDRRGDEAGVPVVQLLVTGGHAWIASSGLGPDSRLGCTSAWRRLRSGPAEPSPADHPGPRSALLDRVVALRLVHHITGRRAGPETLLGLDLTSLADVTCRVRPHPLARPLVQVRDEDRIAALRVGPPLPAEEFSRRAALAAGPYTGFFSPPDERDLSQVPLRCCAITVADPAGLLGRRPTVIGVGPDFTAARHDAALRAFACYGSLMVDPRRMRDGMLTGYDVIDDTAHAVAAEQVFPALHPTGDAYRVPVGAVAAYRWKEAVVRGTLAHCRQLSLADSTRSGAPAGELDMASAKLDARGDRLRTCLRAAGVAVRAYDVTGPLGIPTVVCSLGPALAGAGCGLTVADALTDALEEVVLRLQSDVNGQPEYAPASVPGPIREARPRRSSPRRTGPIEFTECVTALGERGYRVLAVPLDHDPEVSAIMPYIVQVVLTHA